MYSEYQYYSAYTAPKSHFDCSNSVASTPLSLPSFNHTDTEAVKFLQLPLPTPQRSHTSEFASAKISNRFCFHTRAWLTNGQNPVPWGKKYSCALLQQNIQSLN